MSSRGAEGRGPLSPDPCVSVFLLPFAAAEWTRPGGGGARHGATASAPPPDAPPSAPRSPRERGCCLGAAARGAGCRPRCCRWT